MGIHRKIRQARPRLSEVSPLVFSISWGFVVTNFFIAHALFISEQSSFLLENEIWAIIFVLISLGLSYGLVMNEWKLIKKFLAMGLFTKSVWTIYLVLAVISTPETTGILGLWLMLAWTQAMSIVHFIPTGWGDEPSSLRK